MADILTDKEYDIISNLTYHAITNPIEIQEYPYQDNKIILMPNLPDTSPFIRELRKIGWYGEMTVKPLYSIPGVTGSLYVEGQTEPRITERDIQIIHGGSISGGGGGVPPSSTVGSDRRSPRRGVRGILSRWLPFLRRRSEPLQSKSYFDTKSGVQRIDLSKLDDIDILKEQNKQILKKLSSMGIMPYFKGQSSDPPSVLGRVQTTITKVSSAIGSAVKQKRIRVRGLDFYISPERTTESQISSKLMNVFGSKIQVMINGQEPTENEVVVIKVEPVGQSPTDVMYNFLEENIRKHVLTDKYLFINKDERIKEDKFGDYIRDLAVISKNDIYEPSDKNSYKNFVVVLRLIHMEMLKEINKIAKSSYHDSNVIVVLPWCFVNHSVPSVTSPPEQKLYSDMPDADGLRFLSGVVNVLPLGENTEQIYFDENTLRIGLEQTLEAKTETEKALYTLANTAIELAKGKKDDDATLQVMKFIFYTHPKGFPHIVSRGSLQRLERSIQTNITKLKGETYFNNGEPGEESIFQEGNMFTEGDIRKSKVNKPSRSKKYYHFEKDGNVDKTFTKSSYVYKVNEIKSLEEFVSHMYSLFKKFNLLFDILKNLKDVIPDAIKSEINDAVDMFMNNPYIMVLITNTYHSSFKGREKKLGISFLEDIINFNKLLLTQINDTLLYAIKKGVVIDRETIGQINHWLTIAHTLGETSKSKYHIFLNNEDNHIYNLEYETSLSRAIKKAQGKFTKQDESDTVPPVVSEPLIRRSARLQQRSAVPAESAESAVPAESAAPVETDGRGEEEDDTTAVATTEQINAKRAGKISEVYKRLKNDYTKIIDDNYDVNKKYINTNYPNIFEEEITESERSTSRLRVQKNNAAKLAEIFIDKEIQPIPKPSSITSRNTRKRSKRQSKRTTIKRKGRQ